MSREGITDQGRFKENIPLRIQLLSESEYGCGERIAQVGRSGINGRKERGGLKGTYGPFEYLEWLEEDEFCFGFC